MQVQLKDGNSIPMNKLQVGDRVKVDVDTNKYEAVYGFGHREELQSSDDYLEIQWGKKQHLEISNTHMLLISSADSSEWRMVPASKVEVGDKVKLDGGDVAQVSSIKQIRGKGLYAPLTFSGKIVVNGVQASQYISVQEQEHLVVGSVHLTFLNIHSLTHAFILPLRWIAPLLKDVAWIQSFLFSLIEIVRWVLALPLPMLLPIAIPSLSVLVVLALVETLALAAVDHVPATLLAIGVMVAIKIVKKKYSLKVDKVKSL